MPDVGESRPRRQRYAGKRRRVATAAGIGGASTNGETSDERTEVLDFPLQPGHSGLARIFYLCENQLVFFWESAAWRGAFRA